MRKSKFSILVLILMLNITSISVYGSLSYNTIKKDSSKREYNYRLRPFYTRLSIYTPVVNIEKSLFASGHSLYAEYSAFPIPILQYREPSYFLWVNSAFAGYRYYFDFNFLRKEIDYFNRSAFFVSLYNRFIWANKKSKNVYYYDSRIGIDIGRQITYKFFYCSLSLGVEKNYIYYNENSNFNKKLSFVPKIRLGVFMPYTKPPHEKTKKKIYENKLKPFYFRLNIAKIGINVEKSIFNKNHTLNLGIHGWFDLPLFLSAYKRNSPAITHDINFSYKYYYNLNRRIRLKKDIRNYTANYVMIGSSYISSWFFKPKNDNFYSLSLSWGGQATVLEPLYIGYDLSASIFFNNSKIVYSYNTPIIPRINIYVGFYF